MSRRSLGLAALAALAVSACAPTGVAPSASPSPAAATTTTTPTVAAADPDGTWRFVTGARFEEAFRNPATGAIYVTFEGDRFLTYPADACNTASGEISIDGDQIELGPMATTEVGCGEPPRPHELFAAAMEKITTIGLDGNDLHLSGPGAELHLTRAEVVDLLGTLPLTAAGESFTFDVPDGRARSNRYLISRSTERPGAGVRYELTAATAGSPATWHDWAGEPEEAAVEVDGSGPVTVVIPGDIQLGDYALCSEYWRPDPFCFTLQVRPASAPWIVTSGQRGVVLHDADGTSSIVSEEPARVAFLVGGQWVIQLAGEPSRLLLPELNDSEQLLLEDGETLLDVSLIGESLTALVTGPAATAMVDLATAERRSLTGPSSAGFVSNGTAITVSADGARLLASDGAGTDLWSRAIAPDVSLAADAEGGVRLFEFHTIQRDAGSDPYYQFVRIEVLDPATGDPITREEFEIAIPDKGHHLDEPCVQVDLSYELLLCSQPDGRVVTVSFSGGKTRTFAIRVAAGTFVQSPS